MKNKINISLIRTIVLMFMLLVLGNNLCQVFSIEVENIELSEIEEESESNDEILEFKIFERHYFLISNFKNEIEEDMFSYHFSVIQWDLSTETPPPNLG